MKGLPMKIVSLSLLLVAIGGTILLTVGYVGTLASGNEPTITDFLAVSIVLTIYVGSATANYFRS